VTNNPLGPNSQAECRRHGLQRPTFVCIHIVQGTASGFFTPSGPPDPFKEAWCERCDDILLREGEWNDTSESFAQVTMICEGCYEERRAALKGTQ